MADEVHPLAPGQLSISRDVFSIVVLGASGDLAKKKTYPSLFDLFASGLLPRHTHIYGYARSARSNEEFREHLREYIKDEKGILDDFLSICTYHVGQYDGVDDFAQLDAAMTEQENKMARGSGDRRFNRLFYFAVPPVVFIGAARAVNASARTDRGWNRLVIEKPFGHDLESSRELASELSRHFREDEIYRIDHYLGKEMVQNLMILRFGNSVFDPLWDRHHISTVTITFKEPFGTEGRAGYFDGIGIIRDVMQNHLLQVLSLVAMEQPVSMHSEHVRDEKAKVLRCVGPASPDTTVLGQYTSSADGTKVGYQEEDERVHGSNTPTFATTVLNVHNPRWAGVPFILKCGKALNERKAEVRIQFHDPPVNLFRGGGAAAAAAGDVASAGGGASAGAGAGANEDAPTGRVLGAEGAHSHSNELVIRIQPDEAVYLKLLCKMPGLQTVPVASELDLTFKQRFPLRRAPEAYARLVLDVLRGDQSQFVRTDELDAAWKIFTPLLRRIDGAEGGTPLRPYPYRYGSRGPRQSDQLVFDKGYRYDERYSSQWKVAQESEALQEVRAQYTLSQLTMMKLWQDIMEEMERGLASEEPGASSLLMLNSFLEAVPNGEERGRFFGLDVGGSTVRVAPVTFDDSGVHPERAAVQETIPAERKATTRDHPTDHEGFFRYLAGAVRRAGVENGDRLGFTFSFPCRQTALNRGVLVKWTKGWDVPGVVGEEVVGLLEEALAAEGLEGVRVCALVNDTVGTFAYARAKKPRCRMGIILGTGTNAAYMEAKANVTKLPLEERTKGNSLLGINMEWGNLGSGNRRFLPLTPWDHELDEGSNNTGEQRFEKMISGQYLGALVRLTLAWLCERNAVFHHGGEEEDDRCVTGTALCPTFLKDPMEAEPIGAGSVFACVRDRTEKLDGVRGVLESLGVRGASQKDCKVVQEVCILVTKRAARLVAVAIAAVLSQQQLVTPGETPKRPEDIPAVGIDGSVFVANRNFESDDKTVTGKGFDKWISEALDELGVACTLESSHDGSGAGAAVIAAVADRLQQQRQ